jgi:protein KRI1
MALERPNKRVKLLNNDSAEESDSETSLHHTEPAEAQHAFKINKDYARRFEHNKQREEKQRRKHVSDLSRIDR